MNNNDYKKGSISVWENTWSGKTPTFSLDKPVYDWDYFDLFRAKYLEQWLIKDKNILCIECGCGSASVSAYFAGKGVKTVMLDASPSALKVAKINFAKYNLEGIFINGNMENLPIASEKFDLVISFGVLEHFEDMKPSIKEMARILKKGGTFFAAVSPRKHSIQLIADLTINTLMRFLYNLKHGWFKKAFFDSYPAKPEFYENSFSARQYVKIVEECGLADVKLSGSRPFPSLNLPVYLFRFYIRFMEILRTAHLFFETHSSRFTELFGVEWNIIGYKK